MHEKKILYKVVSFVSRDELDFLDGITKDLYFSSGKKVPRSQIIKEIIHISKNINHLKKEIMQDLDKEMKNMKDGREDE
jgi:hypothetical protein